MTVLLAGNYAQSTVAGTITNVATSITLASSTGFVVPGTGQQGVCRIDDTGNAAWTQLAGPFEIAYFGTNSANVLGSLVRGQEGTTARSFAAGATVTQVMTAAEISNTLQLIATTTLGAPTASITYSSLPTSFKHLQIDWQARGDNASGSVSLICRINGDSTAIYDYQVQEWSGTSTITANYYTGNSAFSIGSIAAASSGAGLSGSGRFLLPNYNDTLFNQHGQAYCTRNDATTNSLLLTFGPYKSAVAVTSLVLSSPPGNLLTGSVFSLYGMP